MEELKRLLSILDADSSVESIESTFSKIADILLFKSYIKTEINNYRILEIEFYFKNKNHEDNVTLARTVKEGMWWLHDWGVDLSFRSEENSFYGGILIRSIIPFIKNSNKIDDKAIFDPRKCCWYMFDSSALDHNMAPQIVMNDEARRHDGEIGTTSRYLTSKPKKEDGDYRDCLYRFYVNGLDLRIEPNYKKASPWKK